MAEFIALSRIRRLDVCLLAPGVVPLNKDINGAGAIDRIVVLIAVDALRATAFIGSRHGQSSAITTQRDAVAFQRAAIAEVVAHFCV